MRAALLSAALLSSGALGYSARPEESSLQLDNAADDFEAGPYIVLEDASWQDHLEDDVDEGKRNGTVDNDPSWQDHLEDDVDEGREARSVTKRNVTVDTSWMWQDHMEDEVDDSANKRNKGREARSVTKRNVTVDTSWMWQDHMEDDVDDSVNKRNKGREARSVTKRNVTVDTSWMWQDHMEDDVDDSVNKRNVQVPGWQGWIIGGKGDSCTDVCTAAGLTCKEEDLEAHNGEVDTEEELDALLEELQSSSRCVSSTTPQFGSKLKSAPAFKERAIPSKAKCYVSLSGRPSSSYKCNKKAKPNGSRRICFCSGEPEPAAELCDANLNYLGPPEMTPQQTYLVWKQAFNPHVSEAANEPPCSSVVTIALGEGCAYHAELPQTTVCPAASTQASGTFYGPWQVAQTTFDNAIYSAGMPTSCAITNPCCTAYVAKRIIDHTCTGDPSTGYIGPAIQAAPEFCCGQWSGPEYGNWDACQSYYSHYGELVAQDGFCASGGFATFAAYESTMPHGAEPLAPRS